MIATHNRRDVLAHTLDRLSRRELDGRDDEVIVIDNASTENISDVVRGRRGVRLVRLTRNFGSTAKAFGVDVARGRFVLFLDDDSYPRPGSIARMLSHFAADERLGAVGFMIHLHSGGQECSALPHVFVGCGVGFRARALRQVGGLDRSFFMQAEEYDLTFRLLRAGWRVDLAGDLAVDHLKTPQARMPAQRMYYDVCNNLRIVARYLSPPFRTLYRDDWLQRYRWIAELHGHTDAFERGRRDGLRQARFERAAFRGWRLREETVEAVFGWAHVQLRMRQLAARGADRIVLADLSKNVYAFRRGAELAGLQVLAIADDGLAAPGRLYRGIPVVPTDEALALGPDAIVISNMSYVHAELRREALSRQRHIPVARWYGPPDAHSPRITSVGRAAVGVPRAPQLAAATRMACSSTPAL